MLRNEYMRMYLSAVLPIYSSDEYAVIVIFHFYSDYWEFGMWCFACRAKRGIVLVQCVCEKFVVQVSSQLSWQGIVRLIHYTGRVVACRECRDDDAGKTLTWQPRTIRSSANAKSTARPSCLVGVLYDISRQGGGSVDG